MKIRVEKKWYTVEVQDVYSDFAVVLVDGERFEVKLYNSSFTSKSSFVPSETLSDPEYNVDSLRQFKSPMPGTIISILVKPGEKLIFGQEIVVLESMKMQQTLKSDIVGTVVEIKAAAGDQVSDGDVILLIT